VSRRGLRAGLTMQPDCANRAVSAVGTASDTAQRFSVQTATRARSSGTSRTCRRGGQSGSDHREAGSVSLSLRRSALPKTRPRSARRCCASNSKSSHPRQRRWDARPARGRSHPCIHAATATIATIRGPRLCRSACGGGENWGSIRSPMRVVPPSSSSLSERSVHTEQIRRVGSIKWRRLVIGDPHVRKSTTPPRPPRV
jgi:hypothetical protein